MRQDAGNVLLSFFSPTRPPDYSPESSISLDGFEVRSSSESWGESPERKTSPPCEIKARFFTKKDSTILPSRELSLRIPWRTTEFFNVWPGQGYIDDLFCFGLKVNHFFFKTDPKFFTKKLGMSVLKISSHYFSSKHFPSK